MPATPRERLGQLVVDRRVELRLSVTAAAALAGIDRRTWATIESGTRDTEEYIYGGVEQALRWPAGTIRRVLTGGEPAEPDGAGRSEFGLFLLDAMTRHRPPLGREDLATAVGVDTGVVTEWILGRAGPTADQYARIMAVLAPPVGCDLDPDAADVNDLLRDGALPAADRDALRRFLKVALGPYRALAEHRNPSSGSRRTA